MAIQGEGNGVMPQTVEQSRHYGGFDAFHDDQARLGDEGWHAAHVTELRVPEGWPGRWLHRRDHHTEVDVTYERDSWF